MAPMVLLPNHTAMQPVTQHAEALRLKALTALLHATGCLHGMDQCAGRVLPERHDPPTTD